MKVIKSGRNKSWYVGTQYACSCGAVLELEEGDIQETPRHWETNIIVEYSFYCPECGMKSFIKKRIPPGFPVFYRCEY